MASFHERVLGKYDKWKKGGKQDKGKKGKKGKKDKVFKLTTHDILVWFNVNTQYTQVFVGCVPLILL